MAEGDVGDSYVENQMGTAFLALEDGLNIGVWSNQQIGLISRTLADRFATGGFATAY